MLRFWLARISLAVDAQPWKGGLEQCSEQSYDVSPSEIDGNLPPELTGTLYRCGPGRIRVGENKYGHWFDGDGMVSPSLQFANRG